MFLFSLPLVRKAGLIADIQESVLGHEFHTERCRSLCETSVLTLLIEVYKGMAQNQLPGWPLQTENYVVCELFGFGCELVPARFMLSKHRFLWACSGERCSGKTWNLQTWHLNRESENPDLALGARKSSEAILQGPYPGSCSVWLHGA